MNEQGPELKLGALADEQPRSSMRKPWHAPQVIKSTMDQTAHLGASFHDTPADSQAPS
jgi:hypothetical protein